MCPSPHLPDSNQDDLLRQAVSAIRSRDTSRAETLLIQLVKQQPDSFEAWYLLASISTDARQARLYARQALRIEPQNQQAIALLRRIETGKRVPRQPRPRRRRSTFRRWLGISLLIGTLSLILSGFVVQSRANQDNAVRSQTPTLDPSPSPTPLPTWTPTPSIAERASPHLAELGDAWSAREWQQAIAILNAVTVIDPHYPGLDSAKCDTYLHWARDLVQSGAIDQAYAQYRRGALYCGQESVLLEEKKLALTYLSGQWRWDHQDWQGASTRLLTVYEAQPDYAQVSSLLYTSYISSCHELLSEGHLELAQESVQQALVVQPDSKQAQDLLTEIRARLAPPTPTPVPAYTGDKRIEISLSEQRMYVWAGDQLVYHWVCSTGEPGRETIPGRFQILDKYPEAWASTWGIRMPYWMGIYWAGTLENGIHALPINPDGSKLWEGLLGSRVSYGCVILSTENARTLYNWAPVGTPVWIHY